MTDWFTEADVKRAARAISELHLRALGQELSLSVHVRRDIARVALSAVKPNQWQTMESAPKDGTLILLGAQNTCESWVAEGYYELSTKRWIAANRYWSDDADWTFHPSHWMPLPQPPEGE